MAESSKGASPVDSESADNPLAAFGANEWLVDEMYEQYQRDPNSVDKAWWDFFKDNAPTSNGGQRRRRRAAGEAPSPRAGPGEAGRAKPAAKPAAQAAEKRRPPPRSRPRTAASPRADARPTQPSSTSPGAQGAGAGRAEAEATDEPTYTVLRGAPARTVAEHGRQPDRPDRDQRPLGPGQAARGTTASSSTTTSPAPAAARCPSPT